MLISHSERSRRWQLLLGPETEGILPPETDDTPMESVLGAVYSSKFSYGMSSFSGNTTRDVSRWLEDIHSCFSEESVDFMINDAIDRHNIEGILLQPEVLKSIRPSVQVAARLLQMKHKIPPASLNLARQIVGVAVHEIRNKLEPELRNAVHGVLSRHAYSPRTAAKALDWNGTIRKNLGRYNVLTHTITPERFLFFRYKHKKDVIVALDQSASMARSAITAVTAAAVLADVAAIQVQFLAFDTEVTEITDSSNDVVETLMSLRFSGGTNIADALEACKCRIAQPRRTALVLISDLRDVEGARQIISELSALVQSGTSIAVLLPNAYNAQLSRNLSENGIMCSVMTPAALPNVIQRILF